MRERNVHLPIPQCYLWILDILKEIIFAGCVPGDQPHRSSAFALHSLHSAVRLREVESRHRGRAKERQCCILCENVYGHHTKVKHSLNLPAPNKSSIRYNIPHAMYCIHSHEMYPMLGF